MATLLAPSPIVRIERNAPIDLSPLTIGAYNVRRSRLPGTNYVRYSIMSGDDIAGRQISYPDESDCSRHVNQFKARSLPIRQQAAMLDTELHGRIIGILRTKEMDARDLCLMFSKTTMVMAPLLSMLVLEERIIRRGTMRRPIYTAPPARIPTFTSKEQ